MYMIEVFEKKTNKHLKEIYEYTNKHLNEKSPESVNRINKENTNWKKCAS